MDSEWFIPDEASKFRIRIQVRIQPILFKDIWNYLKTHIKLKRRIYQLSTISILYYSTERVTGINLESSFYFIYLLFHFLLDPDPEPVMRICGSGFV